MGSSIVAYKHVGTIGKLKRNLSGGINAGQYYSQALFLHLNHHHSQPTEGYPCLFFSKIESRPTLFAITDDDLLIIAPNLAQIDIFHRILESKYSVKRIGNPTDFLGWSL